MSLTYNCSNCRERSVVTSRYDKKYPPGWMELDIERRAVDLCPKCIVAVYKKLAQKLFDRRAEKGGVR